MLFNIFVVQKSSERESKQILAEVNTFNRMHRISEKILDG